jgi:predicted nucleotide-binding protein (sugar kinase/HSP70/actin superfamily)
MKKPYWESVLRTLGTAVHLKDQIDGIIYLSSFSCGLDSIVTELIREHVKDIPLMVLKIDGHKGMEGYLTRIEAFADLLEERSAS